MSSIITSQSKQDITQIRDQEEGQPTEKNEAENDNINFNNIIESSLRAELETEEEAELESQNNLPNAISERQLG